jgi:DoxX-like family
VGRAHQDVRHPLAVSGTAQVGYPEHLVRPIGLVELAATLLFVVPRTRLVGALFLTAYYGGATATHVRLEQPFFFPVVFGALLWISLWLRDRRLGALL